jgi:hypothetical protein
LTKAHVTSNKELLSETTVVPWVGMDMMSKNNKILETCQELDFGNVVAFYTS